MAIKTVTLSARIPVSVKNQLDWICENQGYRTGFLVTEALREKLQEMLEDVQDLKVAEERMKSQMTSYGVYRQYMRRRLKRK